jgi:leader peptidase (prepilin peptidase)/N-methyltransferase
MHIFYAVIFFVAGLVFGSFMNVLIYRTPRQLNIATPPSACPKCASPIRWYSNIPVISYVVQRGKCKSCGGDISIQYPLVELLTALIFLLIYLRFGLGLMAFKYALMAFILLAAGFTDLFTALDKDFECGIIPDGFTVGGVFLGLIWSFFTPPGFIGSLAGAGAGAFVLLIPAYFFYALTKREGLGEGDAKLMAMIGSFFGPGPVVFVLTASAIVGVSVGISVIAVTHRRQSMIPYGPMISAAAIVYIFFGEKIDGILNIGGL